MDKKATKNWADEVDGGDDDETIGGANAPQVPVTEPPKERFPTPPKREKNARGEIIVSSIRLKDLDPVKKFVDEQKDESDEEEEEEEEKPEVETKEEEQKSKCHRCHIALIFRCAGTQAAVEEGAEEAREGER